MTVTRSRTPPIFTLLFSLLCAAQLLFERRVYLGAVLETIRTASQADPAIATLWQRIQSEFLANQRAIMRSLAARDALRPGLGVDEAADLLWTLNHPALWTLLVGERRWTPERFEAWLADTFCAQLLGRPARFGAQASAAEPG